MPLPDYKNAIKEDIGAIYITGGGFINREFRGVGRDSKLGWQELVRATNPTRALNFALSDIDQIDIGLVARCEVNLKYMNIQDYRDLRQIVGRESHFMVRFFDTDDLKWYVRDMYCTESGKGQLYKVKESLVGTFDCPIKFAGTNLDLDTIYKDHIDEDGNIGFKITYDTTNLLAAIPAQTVGWGEVAKTVKDTDISVIGGNFDCWERLDNAGNVIGVYGANQSVTVWSDMKFRARIKNL